MDDLNPPPDHSEQEWMLQARCRSLAPGEFFPSDGVGVDKARRVLAVVASLGRPARHAADDWAAFLEKQAGAATTVEQRAAYDPHRVGVYLQMKQPQRGLGMLEASERDLPDDYNPPARLAVLYKALKRYDDALAASDRALSKAYGPRKIGILQTRSDIYREKGDLAQANRTMEDALAFAESLPAGQRSERQIASLKKKIAGDGK